ncbi:MAG: hypothetical protein M3024_00680 [Candidatus Dormibacteraeota bacterium]|nr:hypothetical protein [Candidatus Dormibacteraeota bacterium]
MTEVSRRRFIATSSIAVGAAAMGGALAAIPHMRVLPATLGPATTSLAPEVSGEALVLHVSNIETAEVSLMMGTREIVYHDRQLVAGLLNAAKRAAPAGR